MSRQVANNRCKVGIKGSSRHVHIAHEDMNIVQVYYADTQRYMKKHREWCRTIKKEERRSRGVEEYKVCIWRDQ
jgi:hypothetical protein